MVLDVVVPLNAVDLLADETVEKRKVVTVVDRLE